MFKGLRDWWRNRRSRHETSAPNPVPSRSDHETSAPSVKVEGNFKVCGDVNDSSKHYDLRGVTAGTINFGQIDSTQEGCTSNVTGGSNMQQPPSSENSVTKMLKTINKQMWSKVNKKNEVFQRENLTEPESEVYPQISESPNFYKGEHIVKTKENSNAMRNEYIKEEMFHFETRSETNSVSFESVMQEFSNQPQPESGKQLPVFGLFAQAGAGKTTFMRNWAKITMRENKISPENNYLSPENNRFQLLLYYDVKDLVLSDDNNTTTLLELLFGGIVDNPKQLYDWMMDNQDKVAIFFDGLDQAPWDITEKHETGLGPKQKADIPTILCNLLSRNLLPESSIIISSREFKASSLPYKARPHKVYTLTGFSSKDAKSLFNTLVTPKDENQCEVICQNDDETPYEKFTKTLSFQQFLTIPMFLTFAALVYKSFKGFIPNSVTALLAKVLELLRRSDNTQERDNIWKIISKLKVLAHEGMTKGSVVFTNNDLDIHGFKINDACDLLLMVPGENTLSQRFLEGDFQLFFCHQIIQEFLSACYIVELSLKRFSKFVEEDLHEQRWSVVRRFVCGLLFLKSINGNLVRSEILIVSAYILI